MIYEIMRYCKNFFPADKPHYGTYLVENGGINLPFLRDGQYFLVEGSVFNDGVYIYPTEELSSEEFKGKITPLAPPRAFLETVERVEMWHAKYGKANGENMSPFMSESFSDYSYSKGSSGDGITTSWKTAFKQELSLWRKL